MVKIGKYDYQKSTSKSKKLMVIVEGKKIHEQFKDKTDIWKSKNHGDDKRRKSYLSRAKGIKDKNGNLTWKNPKSPNYHSIRILW